MSYITKQDLLDELGEQQLIQLTDSARTGGVDESVVDKALAFAGGTFDAYARTRYSLPVPATAKVKALCLDLAIYKLKKARVTTSEGIDNLRKSYYDPSIKFLEALQSGKAALDVPAADETTESPAIPDRVLSGTVRKVFTDEKLDSY